MTPFHVIAASEDAVRTKERQLEEYTKRSARAEAALRAALAETQEQVQGERAAREAEAKELKAECAMLRGDVKGTGESEAAAMRETLCRVKQRCAMRMVGAVMQVWQQSRQARMVERWRGCAAAATEKQPIEG